MARISSALFGLNVRHNCQKVFRFTLVCSVFFTVFQAHANECKIAPQPKKESKKPNVKTDEVLVSSRKANLTKDQLTEFEGDVVIYQNKNTVEANKATFDEIHSQFTAQGNVKLSSESAYVIGESILIDEANKNFSLQQAQYNFNFNNGRGTSETFEIKNNSELELTEATFTTCPGDKPSWLFSADNININQESGWGEAWGTVFELGDIPIAYVPYITFPVTDTRKSGLLFPDIGNSSRYGSYYAQPIYFNLAPNYDLTFKPEYMSKRGLLLDTNFRHIDENSANIIQIDYLNNDQALTSDESRYLTYWQHSSQLSDKWNVQLQWTELGDDSFLNEFGSNYHHQADTYLNNFVAVQYQTNNTQVQFLSQDMNELGQYRASYVLPLQINLNWQNSLIEDQLNFDIYSQYSYFENDNADIDKAHRMHLAPTLAYSLYQPGYQFLASSSYMVTHYQQHEANTDLTEDVTRGIVKHRVLAGLTFEKFSNYFGNAVRQTLEPKMQYLYVADNEQENIGIYDSQKLKEDYYSLFRDTSYSSIDRIAPANQIALGFTSSIFDSKNNELFRFGLGQLHKFSDNESVEQELNSKSALAVEWFGQISENWQFEGALLYEQGSKRVETGYVSFDYWLDENRNIQINHRYSEDVAGAEINQSGVFTSYKINDSWSVAASYHYDFATDTTLDSLIGFEYTSCCWSIQLSAQRQVIIDLNTLPSNNIGNLDYENNIGIKFKLNGLGGDMASSIANLFSKSIFAYRRPYLITN